MIGLLLKNLYHQKFPQTRNKIKNKKPRVHIFYFAIKKYIFSVMSRSKLQSKMIYLRERAEKQEKDERRKTKIKSIQIIKQDIY